MTNLPNIDIVIAWDRYLIAMQAYHGATQHKRRKAAQFVDVAVIHEYGLDQKLSNAIRCF